MLARLTTANVIGRIMGEGHLGGSNLNTILMAVAAVIVGILWNDMQKQKAEENCK